MSRNLCANFRRRGYFQELVAAVIAVAIVCSLVSCSDETDNSLRRLNTQEIEALRDWSLQFISASSNRVPTGSADRFIKAPLPDTLKRIKAPYTSWIVSVFQTSSNGDAYISFVSLGSYASEQILVGSTNFLIPTNQQCKRISEGIYVVWSGH